MRIFSLMKILGYITLLLLLVSFSGTPILSHEKTIHISPGSQLKIIGTSNVKDFDCVFNIKNIDQPIPVIYREKGSSIFFENTTIVLENAFFDCGGKGINRDFHDLLKSKQHPEIHLSLKEIKNKSSKKNKVEAIVEMEIAGVSKLYAMHADIHRDEDLLISGILRLNISDFGLEAPKKMFGLIVVSEEITIDFQLLIKEGSR